MKAEQEIIVRYGEIFLKSKPVFQRFERKLIENIAQSLKRENIKFGIKKERGRIFILAGSEALNPLKKVVGIVSFSPVYHLKTADLKKIKSFCRKKFGNFLKKGETFAVRAKRTGSQRYSSKDLENEVGSLIKGKVDLKNPQKTIFIEIREKDCYLFTEVFAGPGGMPLSTAGKVVSLLSGGIDSPASSFLLMKRGCRVIFLHFHSFPLVSKKSIEKCFQIVKKLNDYQFKSKLILIPFQKIQLYLKAKAPAKYLVLLYRRSMVRIGEKISKVENSQALVTGESLAQVASQTLSNLAAVEETAKEPIFRPLIGMDKNEIIDLAKKIGTFSISILPQEDCCTLFSPKHPATQADKEVLKKIERKIKIKKLEQKAFKDREEFFI